MNVSTEVRQLVRKRSRSRDVSCRRQRGKNLYQSRTWSALIDEIAASNDFGLISCAGPPGGGPIDAAYVCVPSSVAFDSKRQPVCRRYILAFATTKVGRTLNRTVTIKNTARTPLSRIVESAMMLPLRFSRGPAPSTSPEERRTRSNFRSRRPAQSSSTAASRSIAAIRAYRRSRFRSPGPEGKPSRLPASGSGRPQLAPARIRN
jgi:hypothetical protein